MTRGPVQSRGAGGGAACRGATDTVMIGPMLKNRKQISRACRWAAVALLALAPATTALGRSEEQEPDPVDARLEGYPTNVSLPQGSSGLTWVALVFLGALCVGGLFKDAKRSHLD